MHLFDPEQFRGKVVMVTGAGRGTGPGGIGYNAAMAFARAGARLAIIGRTEGTLRRTAEDVRALGGEILWIAGDVSDPRAIARLFEETENAYGRLDILINNAGISGDVRALVRIPSESFRYAFDVHLHTMTTTRLAARLMRVRGVQGTILNVGTYFTSPQRQILRPYPFRTPYTGAQAWKLEHARVSAWELAGDGIRVIALNLGPVEGGRIDSIVYPLGALERGLWGRDVAGADIRRKTEEMHPSGRFLTQEHAARSILALASQELRDAANGTVVELAGGLDYRVPPQAAPPLLGERTPDLSGRQVVLAGRPSAEQAASLILAFTACGARVVLATPGAGALLKGLAEGRDPAEYGDGQKRLLGPVTAIDLRPEREEEIAALFERLTADAPAARGAAWAAADRTAGAAALDAVVIVTGDATPSAGFSDMPPGEHEALKERFAFEPAALMRHALAAMLLQGNRAAGVGDGRFLALAPFLALLARGRGTPSPSGAIQRQAGGWTAEEEKLLQAGARRARGSLVVIGPAIVREEADDAPAIGVLRAGLQAVVTSVATEMATARAGIRVNAIYPGTEAVGAEPSRTARTALQLAADHDAAVSGMIYYPDERNAGALEAGPLSGRTAVVTGGGRNMGQVIALRLAREGARLVVTGRGQADLDLTARAIRALGGQARSVAADISFPGDRERILAEVRAFGDGHSAAVSESGSGPSVVRGARSGGPAAAREPGDGSPATAPESGSGRPAGARESATGGAAPAGVDLWVNNAGIGGAFATLPEIELDGEGRWHQTLAVNFAGAWLAMARAVLDMRRRGARGGVINVSTFYADQPYVFRIPYTVPKILLRTCAELLADALRPYGIFVADIQPSLIDGPRFEWVAKNYAEHFRRHGAADPSSDPAIREWFRRLVPAQAPRQEDVAEAVSFAARRGLTGSGQGIAVSTLPVARAAANGNGTPRPGRTAVIVASGRTTAEIDRAGALAAWCLEAGSRRVVVAADDGMMARLIPHLSKGAAGSPWWNLPIAPEGDGRLEIRGVDPTSASSVADLFAAIGETDTVAYVPGAPRSVERFVLFPADPALSGLEPAAVEERYRDHQRALSIFLDRHVTAGLIVARQAARSLAPAGALLISPLQARTPEAILSTEALRQIVRTATEEYRLLGSERRVSLSSKQPAIGARLQSFARERASA
jgi:NAD(P)-dependent dehydrogenase (short-subunit alcohol dehydrogenase family)